MNNTLLKLLFFTTALFIYKLSFAQPPLEFKHAWIAEAPPVSKVLAAYMEINNPTDKPVIIISMESPDFSRIEFHKSIHVGDIARMQHQKNLVIPANGNLILKQGGYHIMLFNPSRRLRQGDETTFMVNTKKNVKQKIKLTVKKSANSNHHHHNHH